MRNAGACFGKQVSTFVVQLHTVGMPHIVAHPTQILRILRRCAVEFFARVGNVVVVLCQVRVQTHFVCACQFGRLAHQVLAHAERRAGGQCHLRHGTMRCVVPGFNQALAFFQNESFIFHHAVGWQSSLRFAHAHAAARGRKSHANQMRGFNAVVQPHTIGVNVQMVAAGGATRQQQLGHGDLRGHAHHLWREARPNRIQTFQPRKQFCVLHLRHCARQALHHVMVCVHQTRCDHMVPCIDHLVHGAGLQIRLDRFVFREDARHAPVTQQQRRVEQFCACIVLRGNASSTVYEK